MTPLYALDAGEVGAAMPPPQSSPMNDEELAMAPTTDLRRNEEVNAGICAPSSSASSGSKKKRRRIADDIKEVYAEAKGTGFDVKIMRKIVSIRKQDRDKRREEEKILDLYLRRSASNSLLASRRAS